MMPHRTIDMALVYPSMDGRTVQRDKVSVIADSIAKIGLRTPITVRPCIQVSLGREIDAFEIVSGRHRYEAYLKLGMAEIEAFVMEDGEIDARLWELAENLHRADLTEAEKRQHIAEWVRLTEDKQAAERQLHHRGEAVLSDGRMAGHQHRESGISAAARELGIPRSTADRAVKAESITPEAKAVADELGLGTVARAKVASVAPQDQVDAVRQWASPDRMAKKADSRELREQSAEEFAEWLSDRARHDEYPMVISWLEAVNAKPVIDAFRRLNGAVFDKTRAAR